MILIIIISIIFIILFTVSVRLITPHIAFMPKAPIESTPAATGVSFDDVMITTQDGVHLYGWYIPAPNARANLLFFHGNGGNISHCLSSIKIFYDLGMSVFIIDYRGYGKSEGKPSIKGVNLDAAAAWTWLTESKKIPAGKIVVFGRSLGGAVAAELVRSLSDHLPSGQPPGALILESTFSSLSDMTPFPAPLARLLLGGDFWNTEKSVKNLDIPVLSIHSPDDDVIPYRQGQRIFRALQTYPGEAGEKTFLEIRGKHNNGFLESGEKYTKALDIFLGKNFPYP